MTVRRAAEDLILDLEAFTKAHPDVPLRDAPGDWSSLSTDLLEEARAIWRRRHAIDGPLPDAAPAMSSPVAYADVPDAVPLPADWIQFAGQWPERTNRQIRTAGGHV